MLEILQQGTITFCVRLCPVSAGWGLGRACGEIVGTGREGMERSLGKRCQNKRLFNLKALVLVENPSLKQTRQVHSPEFIYQDSSFSDCVASCILLGMVWC